MKEHAVDKTFLEDLAPGQVFTSDARVVVDVRAIKKFAGEFDPQPFHLDEASAGATFFKNLVASGWHTTAMTMQLIIKTLPLSHGIIGTGVDELRWPRQIWQVFTSDARVVVDVRAIKKFAGEFDPQPFHLDEASAGATFFKNLVASGWHTTAMTMQLIIKTLPLSHGIIGTGVDELRWPR